MAVANIFKYAAKKGLRFPFRGMINTEDLFNLSMDDLNKVYQNLKKEQKETSEESLMETDNPASAELEVKIQIVKEIFDDKKADQERAKKAADTKAKKQRILEILAKKKDDELLNMSEEELEAQLAEFDK